MNMPHEIDDPQRVDVLRAELDQMRLEHYGGNLTATARALGVTSAYLSDILKGKRGVGMKVIQGLSSLTGRSIDAVMGRGLGADSRDPIPARAEALAIVEEALRKVRAMPAQGTEGRGVEWWLLQVGFAQAQVRLASEQRDPSVPQGRVADDSVDPEAESGSRPKVVLRRSG